MSDLPDHELDRLRQAVTGRNRTQLLLHPELSPDEQRALDSLVARRLEGEPLQYLEGSVPFGGVEVAVDPRALIPRPETEQLFQLVLDRAEPPGIVVDLCTGSGNLALALQHAWPDAEVHATDVSSAAVALAEENAARLGSNITVHHGDLFDPLPEHLRGAVDVLVANPPYVEEGAELPTDVVGHEPGKALFAGADGLEVLRRIAAEARDWLTPGGLLACEIGEHQGSACSRLFAWLRPTVEQDYTGRDRFVVGRRCQGE